MRKYKTYSNIPCAVSTCELHEVSDQSVAMIAVHKAPRILALAAMVCIGFTSIACETSHTETDKQGVLGGNTHEETTTTHNPITNTDDTTHTETHTP